MVSTAAICGMANLGSHFPYVVMGPGSREGHKPRFSPIATALYEMLDKTFAEHPFRNCPKSPFLAAHGGALWAAKKGLFAPFHPPYTSQIHARRVVRTPFRTVSPRTWVHSRLCGL